MGGGALQELCVGCRLHSRLSYRFGLLVFRYENDNRRYRYRYRHRYRHRYRRFLDLSYRNFICFDIQNYH